MVHMARGLSLSGFALGLLLSILQIAQVHLPSVVLWVGGVAAGCLVLAGLADAAVQRHRRHVSARKRSATKAEPLEPDEVVAGHLMPHQRPAAQNAARDILKAAGAWPHWWQFWRRRGGLTRSEYEAISARETRAQQIIDAATVTYKGNDWGPVPLWTVELPTLNASVDIHAFTEAEARQKAVPEVADTLRRKAG